MLKPEDIEIRRGRAQGGGDFLMVIHRPSGIFRRRGPPLVNAEIARKEMMAEIAAELSGGGSNERKSSA